MDPKNKYKPVVEEEWDNSWIDDDYDDDDWDDEDDSYDEN